METKSYDYSRKKQPKGWRIPWNLIRGEILKWRPLDYEIVGGAHEEKGREKRNDDRRKKKGRDWKGMQARAASSLAPYNNTRVTGWLAPFHPPRSRQRSYMDPKSISKSSLKNTSLKLIFLGNPEKYWEYFLTPPPTVPLMKGVKPIWIRLGQQAKSNAAFFGSRYIIFLSLVLSIISKAPRSRSYQKLLDGQKKLSPLLGPRYIIFIS
jgi:hypothetical protein